MRPPRPLLAALLIAPLLGAPALAGPLAEVRLAYVVTPDPDGGMLAVTLTVEDAGAYVKEMTFRTDAHEYPLTDVTSPGKLEKVAGGHRLTLEDGRGEISYRVRPAKPSAITPGEYNSYLGPSWGVVKSDAIGLNFEYVITYHGEPPTVRFQTTVAFAGLPAGWTVELPYPRDPAGRFVLPADSPRPMGFSAMGPLEVEPFSGSGKSFRYARIGETLSYERDLVEYLTGATPYYETTYGNVTRDPILVISAPSPMFKGGLGSTGSLFVHQESDLRTIAHEYAHVWQAFQTIEEPGASSIWIHEGSAEYGSVLSLLAAELWSKERVDRWLSGEYAKRGEDEAPGGGYYRLRDATYAQGQTAYRKGLFTLNALDLAIAEATGNASGLGHALKRFNAEYEASIKDRGEASNADFERAIEDATGFDASDLFARYVDGTEYPPFTAYRTSVAILLENLTVTPAAVEPGETVVVRVDAVNGSPGRATRDVELEVDGVVVRSMPVSLDTLGERRTLEFRYTPASPGTVKLRVAYLEKDLRVLIPAALSIGSTSLFPEPVEAQRPTLLTVRIANAGEADGAGDLAVQRDGTSLGTQRVTVAGGSSTSAEVRLEFPAPGNATLLVTLTTPAGTSVERVAVAVLARDTDDDGVPDAEDAYPEDPHYSERSPVADVKTVVPVPLPALLAGLGIGAGARLVRRRP